MFSDFQSSNMGQKKVEKKASKDLILPIVSLC